MLRKNKFILDRKQLQILLIGLLALLAVLITVAVMISNGDGAPNDVLPTSVQSSQETENNGLPDLTDPTQKQSEQTNPESSASDPTASAQPDDTGQSETEDTIPAQSVPTDPPPPTQPNQPPDPHTPTEPETERITCDSFAVFSGEFVENGSGMLVENVAAILVTNRSDQFLDMATMVYDVDGREAVFLITGLHPGRSAWVMEKNGMTISADAVFTYKDTIYAFRDDVIVDSEDVTISCDGNMLLAVNNTNRALDNVVVYYKTVHTDGNYFGGITYLVSFGSLGPGEAIEKLAGHYDEANSEIVRIGWQERQTQ